MSIYFVHVLGTISVGFKVRVLGSGPTWVADGSHLSEMQAFLQRAE